METKAPATRCLLLLLQLYTALLLLLVHVTHCEEAGSGEVEQGCKQNSYLWKVHAEPPLFLYGTMHVPYNKIWDDLPSNVKNAFGSSERLYVELLLSDSTTVSQLTDCQMLQGSVSLDDVLSAETQRRITDYLEKVRAIFPEWLQTSFLFGAGGGSQYGNYLFNAIVGNWREKRPIWMLFLLNSLTEENIRLRNIPLLDVFLDNAASGLGHEVVALETTRDQCRPLNNLNSEEVELALNVQLSYLEEALQAPQLALTTDLDVYTYRCGDFSELVATRPILPLPPLANLTSRVSPSELRTLEGMERYLRGQFVTRRNRRIVQTIDGLLQTQRQTNYFVAVGAGHMVGDKNIISRLQRKGYTVEHIEPDATIDGPTLPSDIVNHGHPGAVPRLMPLEPLMTEPDVLPSLSPDAVSKLWKDVVSQYINPSSTQFSDSATTEASHDPSGRSHDVKRRQLTLGGAGYSNPLVTTIHLQAPPDPVLWREDSSSQRSSGLATCSLTSLLLLSSLLLWLQLLLP